MATHNTPSTKAYGRVKGPYKQGSVKRRIEALFLDNIGKVLTREQILEVARDPHSGKEPENWHQRLSELRTDDGYTILILAQSGGPHGAGVSHAAQGEAAADHKARQADSCDMAANPGAGAVPV